MQTVIETPDGLRLDAYVARPSSASGAAGRGLVICHDFPSGARRAIDPANSYPQLADRLAEETGWSVLTFNFRGTGDSEGDFSLAGWLTDLRSAIDTLQAVDAVDGIWAAGFAVGGAIALCHAGEDDRVRGVAALGAPADFDDWAAEPDRFLEHCREIGVVRTSGFPEDVRGWTRELKETRPLSLVGKIPPRPLLVVHGADDPETPVLHARLLADAATAAGDGAGTVDLRVLGGAGHALRHDPRAVAVLLGWLERQSLD